ncbi:MAG: response regulator [Gammaproteobacteria bacterium]
MKNPAKPILLVEDDQIDMMTVKRALTELHVTNRVAHVENGDEALAYLNDPANDRPCLILLDLNMPVMGGIEFLRVVRDMNADPQIKRIPVVVLTTSEEQQDKVESFNMGVAGYIRKPVDYQRFVETMRTINAYWTVSELPE